MAEKNSSHFKSSRLRYPTSFLGLLLVGFGIVTLPLIAGLVSNAFFIERLSEQSQRAVVNATLTTQTARQLSTTASTLEKSARLIAGSGNRELIDAHGLTREQFLLQLQQLIRMPLTPEMLEAANRIQSLEQAANLVFSTENPTPLLQKRIEREFADLANLAMGLNAIADRSVETEVTNLRASAARSRKQVIRQMLAIVPSAFLLIAGFSYLLARPIRDLGAAIDRLGEGKFAKRIRVSGPRDIEKLGQQLDWLRQRLIELEDQKTRFFQHVSHELKTPLTALREGSDLLSEEVVGELNSEQQEIARILKQNSQSLERLIQDLLTYSQSQSARRLKEAQALVVTPLQLLDLVDEVLDTHKIAMVAKSISVRRESEKVSLQGDANKIRVVLDNLLSNAVKYSPVGGTITVRLVKQQENAVIEVLDDGPGIAEADRERIFEPFFRTASAIKSATKGSGLGMAIVRDYVELHHGSVAAVAKSNHHDNNRGDKDDLSGDSADSSVHSTPRGARIRVILPRRPGRM